MCVFSEVKLQLHKKYILFVDIIQEGEIYNWCSYHNNFEL